MGPRCRCCFRGGHQIADFKTAIGSSAEEQFSNKVISRCAILTKGCSRHKIFQACNECFFSHALEEECPQGGDGGKTGQNLRKMMILTWQIPAIRREFQQVFGDIRTWPEFSNRTIYDGGKRFRTPISWSSTTLDE